MFNAIRFLSLFAVVGLLGCGGGGGSSGPKATVKGKVTVGGKGPLTGGTIQFIPASGNFGSGIIKPDGTYTVGDAPVGECKVVVDNKNLKVAAGNGKGAGKMGTAPKGAIVTPEMSGSDAKGTFVSIDAEYTKAETTKLKATLKAGDNSVDFDVK